MLIFQEFVEVRNKKKASSFGNTWKSLKGDSKTRIFVMKEEESNVIWKIFNLMDKAERSKEKKSVLFSMISPKSCLFHPPIEAPPSEEDSIVKLNANTSLLKLEDKRCAL